MPQTRTPTCFFCDFSGSLTREHAYPDWLRKQGLIRRPGVKIDHIHTRQREGFKVDRYWASSELDQKVRIACRDCNGGWMSRMEGRMAELLPPMIAGQRVDLSYDDQTAVAAWALKTGIVLSWTQNRERLTRQHADAAQHLRATGLALAPVRVWLGFLDQPELASIHYGRTARDLSTGIDYGFLETFTLRYLVFQVEHLPAEGRAHYPPSIAFQIWPCPRVLKTGAATWPSGPPLDANALAPLMQGAVPTPAAVTEFRRFMARARTADDGAGEQELERLRLRFR